MIKAESFGVTRSGQPVTVFHLKNSHHMEADILDYGCTVQRLLVPDVSGEQVDVVLGYDTLEGYEAGSSFFGAFVGRYANRIKGAGFELGGKYYQLEKNDGPNHLHGTFCSTVFESRIREDMLEFTYVSPDGEEGFPGKLKVVVQYRLREDNALEMTYLARTDADTVLNLTNHSYFNLNGTGDILGHRLTLAADRYTEADEMTTATGRILSVEGTPFDFRSEKAIGDGLAADDRRITMFSGYDHNFIIEEPAGELRSFAVLKGDLSGICMEASTTQPAFQLYTGNFLAEDKAPFGKGGRRYPKYGGAAIETQHYPCSPNYPDFPSVVLHPGELFREQTVYRFYLDRG